MDDGFALLALFFFLTTVSSLLWVERLNREYDDMHDDMLRYKNACKHADIATTYYYNKWEMCWGYICTVIGYRTFFEWMLSRSPPDQVILLPPTKKELPPVDYNENMHGSPWVPLDDPEIEAILEPKADVKSVLSQLRAIG